MEKKVRPENLFSCNVIAERERERSIYRRESVPDADQSAKVGMPS